jgi:hypothetical protein
MPLPNVRVIVRLPYNRPDQPLADPPRVGLTFPYSTYTALKPGPGGVECGESRYSLESDRKIAG